MIHPERRLENIKKIEEMDELNWKTWCMNKKVDMVEVVRCKDCIHWDKGHTEECGNLDSVCFHNGWCKPDWFCADGERRTDNA